MSAPRRHERTGAIAGLDYSVEVPHDWVALDVPAEKVDFDDPLQVAALDVLMAPYAAIVMAIGARPAFADGSVAQWLEYLSRQRGLDPSPIEAQRVGDRDAVACWGIQVDQGTVMRSRLVFFEDGDRLVNISCMAPDDLWAASEPAFEHALRTFALREPRGAKHPLVADGGTLAACTFAGGAATGVAAKAAKQTPPAPGPLAMPAREDEAGGGGRAAATDRTATDGNGVDAEHPEGAQAVDVALAEDMASFDPEHPMNARLRDNGVGLVPNVLDYHEQERWATVGAGAIVATMRVPFGWHVIDDGRRTLVFDASGHVQVNFARVARDDRGEDAWLAARLEELAREWPGLAHVRTETLGMQCLLLRDIRIDDQPIEQAHLLRPIDGRTMLHVRVTASPEWFSRAADLTEVMLRDLSPLDAVT